LAGPGCPAAGFAAGPGCPAAGFAGAAAAGSGVGAAGGWVGAGGAAGGGGTVGCAVGVGGAVGLGSGVAVGASVADGGKVGGTSVGGGPGDAARATAGTVGVPSTVMLTLRCRLNRKTPTPTAITSRPSARAIHGQRLDGSSGSTTGGGTAMAGAHLHGTFRAPI
jgi:hypothetical protein